MLLGSFIALWTAFASDTLGDFADGMVCRLAGLDGRWSLSACRMAEGESRRSSRWFSSIVWTVRSSVGWFCYGFGRLEFASWSATRFIQRVMTVSGHKNAPDGAGANAQDA